MTNEVSPYVPEGASGSRMRRANRMVLTDWETMHTYERTARKKCPKLRIAKLKEPL